MKRLFAAAVILGLTGASALAQSTEPLVGTWKLNAAKSKGTAFKSVSTKVEVAGAGVKFTVELVGPDGATNWAFTANYDGKDNPVGKSPYGDTVALTRVDAKTTRITVKQGGKVTVTPTIVVSDDGNTNDHDQRHRRQGPGDRCRVVLREAVETRVPPSAFALRLALP